MALSGRCRLCGTGRDLSRHHLIPKRMRISGVPLLTIRDLRNLYLVCRPCHDCIEAGEFRQDVRESLTKTEKRFIVSAVGRPWLDKNYPIRRAFRAAHVVSFDPSTSVEGSMRAARI